MGTHKWEDIVSKRFSPEERVAMKKAAHEEIERIGYAALRKARALTQAEIAEKLHISQPSVAALERRSDLMLSTLAKYVEALGGRLVMKAEFPGASFNLEPPSVGSPGKAADELKSAPRRRRTASVPASPKRPKGRAA